MYTYAIFMYMIGTLKGEHGRLAMGTSSCHIVAGVKSP